MYRKKNKKNITHKKKNALKSKGAIVEKGAIYVLVIMTLLLFGGYEMAGGTLPTRIPEVNPDQVNIIVPSVAEPTQRGLQLYTFTGISTTPNPTMIPVPTDTDDPPILVECGRPFNFNNKPQMIWGFRFSPSQAIRNELSMAVFYTNNNALILGSGLISLMQSTPTDFIFDPLIGELELKDLYGYPFFPALFITDITNSEKELSGDSEAGGYANKPDAVYGSWIAAGGVNPGPNIDLGPGADIWPPANGPDGNHETGFRSEVIWKIWKVKVYDPEKKEFVNAKAGHKYRGQIVLHDGANPSNIGVACVQFRLPNF